MRTKRAARSRWLILSEILGVVLAVVQCRAAADQLDSWQVRKQLGSPGLVAFGNNRFVVSCPQRILVSTNGTDWNDQLAPDFSTSSGLAFGNGQFLALYTGFDRGVNTAASSAHYTVCSSPDGVKWTRCFSYQTSDGNWLYNSRLAAGNGVFLFAGPNLFASTNRVDWNTVIANLDGYFSDLSFEDGAFMGIVWGSGFVTSSDGFKWDFQPFPGVGNYANVRHSNRRFAAFRPVASDGSFPPAVAVSEDGLNWNVNNLADTNSAGLTSAGNQFFLINTISNGFYSSVDATSWQPHTFGTNIQVLDIAYGLGTYVAVGSAILQSAPDTNAPQLASPALSIQPLPGITITGSVGHHYIIEYTENVQDTNSFQPLTNLWLSTSPFLWADTSAANRPRRFYRAVTAP